MNAPLYIFSEFELHPLFPPMLESRNTVLGEGCPNIQSYEITLLRKYEAFSETPISGKRKKLIKNLEECVKAMIICKMVPNYL